MLRLRASALPPAPVLMIVAFACLMLLVVGAGNWIVRLVPKKDLPGKPLPVPFELEKSGTTAGLRGIHALGGEVAWASGTHGTVLRTLDSGHTWQTCATPPGAEQLDFRAVWAWDANTAVVMSSGAG